MCNYKPGPTEVCRDHPTPVMQFLQALEPLFCILSAIDHIILPHQYLQMEQVRRRLSRKEMDRPRLWHTLLSSLCLPFPILRLVSNYSLPTRPYKAASPERRDWVVHAHFGDFKHGVVELPASTHAGVCEPGTVTASMAHRCSGRVLGHKRHQQEEEPNSNTNTHTTTHQVSSEDKRRARV